ncbi:uncharacterized protein [Montipora foliosa]|uniref:uncharacterized protein n=1 Tax=Montipora foliosa TaxID=591990 RepID=UPI0035F13CD1
MEQHTDAEHFVKKYVFSCDACDFYVKSQEQLEEHLKHQHVNEEKPETTCWEKPQRWERVSEVCFKGVADDWEALLRNPKIGYWLGARRIFRNDYRDDDHNHNYQNYYCYRSCCVSKNDDL